MQAFTPFVRVVTDAARHFATFGRARTKCGLDGDFHSVIRGGPHPLGGQPRVVYIDVMPAWIAGGLAIYVLPCLAASSDTSRCSAPMCSPALPSLSGLGMALPFRLGVRVALHLHWVGQY